MDNNTLDSVIVLANDKKLNGEKLRNITTSCCNLVIKLNDDSYTVVGEIAKRCVIVPIVFIMGLRGIYHEFQDIKRREKVTSKVFNIDSNLVTGDLDTFINSEIKFPYFVSSFQYDASVPLDRVQSLEMVWGDTDLRKLHDFNYISSLKVVMGDFYMSTANNLEGLKKLQVVTGDMYMEQFDTLDFLNPSLYVGGNIYTKNGVYEKNYQKNYK